MIILYALILYFVFLGIAKIIIKYIFKNRMTKFKTDFKNCRYTIVIGRITYKSNFGLNGWDKYLQYEFEHHYTKKVIEKVLGDDFFMKEMKFDKFSDNFPVLCFENGHYFPLIYKCHLSEFNIQIEDDMKKLIPFD